jgi:MFS transporter, Spinster family, sphingosine-1-phosphate transporter
VILRREQPYYARGFLGLLLVINLLNYIDRATISGLLESIRTDLGATDAQMGMVGAAFTFTYSMLPPLFGWLGDRWPRTLVITASAVFWSLATAVTGLARTVWQLVMTRGAIGVGEASYMSNAPGLIADLFPAARRGSAMGVFYIASPVGSALGVMLAGQLAAHYGWRTACFLVGLPGILLALLVWRSQEPVRGATDTEDAPQVGSGAGGSFVRALGALVRDRRFVLLALAYTGVIFMQNAVELFLPAVLQRDKGLPLVEASALYGWVLLPAGIVGPLLGSYLGDRARQRTASGYYWVSAWSALATVVPLLLLARATSRTALSIGIFTEFTVAYFSTPLVLAQVVSLAAPAIRSTAAAALLFTVHMLGDFISQPLVGRLSTWMAEGTVPPVLVNGLASLLGTAPDQHLTLALIGTGVPATVIAGVLFVAAIPRTGR